MQHFTQVGLGPGHIVLNGDIGPLPQRGIAPNFRPISVVAKWLDGSRCHLGKEVGLDPSDIVLDGEPVACFPKNGAVLDSGDIVLDGDPAPPPPKGGKVPQFSAHVYCDQTVAWIKMPLGMEVGLGPGHIVLHGEPALPRQKGGTAP